MSYFQDVLPNCNYAQDHELKTKLVRSQPKAKLNFIQKLNTEGIGEKLLVISTDLQTIGGLLKFNLKLHHSGSLTGPDNRGQSPNRRYSLSQVRLFPPTVELIDDTLDFPSIAGMIIHRQGRYAGRVAGDGSLSLSKPVAGNDAEMGGPGLVVSGNFRIRVRVRVLEGGFGHGDGGRRGRKNVVVLQGLFAFELLLLLLVEDE